MLFDIPKDDSDRAGRQIVQALRRAAHALGWRTCQNRTTRCAVDGDNRSKLAKAASSAGAEVPLALGRAMMIARAVGPAIARGLAQDEDRVGPVAGHQPVRGFDRHPAEHGKRSHRLLEFLSLANSASSVSLSCRSDAAR